MALSPDRDTRVTMTPPAHPEADLPARAVIASIAAFWIGWVVLMSARAALIGFAEPGDLLVRRLVAAGMGATLTIVFWRGLRWVRGASPVRLVAAALAGAIPATVAFACVNWFVFYGWHPTATFAEVITRWGYGPAFRYAVADTSVSWFFFFGGWSILYLFLRTAARSAAAQKAAIDAQLRALRYQINPHFLFNALNALADLVQNGRAEQADRMILDLSALLRRMLSDADAAPEVTLAEEIDLQRLYLALEARRFEDRLQIEIDLPEALADARVPRLILQPLVENAVKHAVGTSHAMVTIRIGVVADRQRLTLLVDDDGRAGGSATPGFGIGLANVRDRLRMRYGAGARLTVGAGPQGGYRAAIELPHG